MRGAFRYLWAVPLLMAVGCGSASPAEPDLPAQAESVHLQPSTGFQTNRYLWGLWEVRISADRQSAEVIPQRAAAMHLNAVRMLEDTPCTDCLRIDNIITYPPNELYADLTLRHPYPGLPKYTGFDVRGIFISGADYTFPASGRSIAWGEDVPRMLNHDGYTSLFNPTEFPPTHPPALGYIRGHRATGGDLSATLNPFVAYAKGAPRRMFEAASVKTRTVRLRVPEGPLEFGYAVDACWQKVDGDVTDPLNDFPPDANCLEPYQIYVGIGTGLMPEEGSLVPIDVLVCDHQGPETIAAVTVEAPGLFGGELVLEFLGATGKECFRFTGMISNETGAGQGEYPVLVKVTSTEADQNLGLVDAWNVQTLRIRETWARTWGGTYFDYGYAIALDASGDVYITGSFGYTVDFDPGPGIALHKCNGTCDAFVSKFDSAGSFQWAATWGAVGYDEGFAVAVDGSGNVYVTGQFTNLVDFDPGPGSDLHESNGPSNDAYLSKFDSSGLFQWARTWGGSYGDWGYGAAVDASGDVYVTGNFMRTVDLDPGPGSDIHDSNGKEDVFLSKFDSSGSFLWGRSWGGAENDRGQAITADSSNDIYVTGSFSEIADFDPGPESDLHDSNGWNDAFLSKFDSSGVFQWARTWGAEKGDVGHGVAHDTSGNIFITGQFSETVDFDPGPGIEEHTAQGGEDIFLAKLDSSGAFQWARTWGGEAISYGSESGRGVAVDDSGNVYTAGTFYEIADFDPGPGEDLHGWSYSHLNAFLSKFDPTGSFQWAQTWESWSIDRGCGVAADGSGNIFITGSFEVTVDFDPGPGKDMHESNGHDDVFLLKLLSSG